MLDDVLDLEDGGVDEGLHGGRGQSLTGCAQIADTAALILQQKAVRLIQVGNVGNALWGLQSISEEIGAVGARSVVAFDGAVYWLATDGFRKFTLGGGIQFIGAGAIDQWFLSLLDQSDMSLVQGTIDPFRKCVLWRWKRAASGDSVLFQDVIGYNWQYDRWFTLTIPTTYLAYAATAAVTWDSFTGTWDGATVTWDSRALQGGQPLLGMMNGSYVFGFFAGASLAATIETGVANIGSMTLINRADPIDDCATGTLQLGVKFGLDVSTTWKTGAARSSTGRVPLRGKGKNIAFRRNIPAAATWTYAKGIDHLDARPGGPR